MSAFAMCDPCRGEYQAPNDRRFHAQPIACPDCGPQLWLEHQGEVITKNVVDRARNLVGAGQTIAIKGIGGFHLACDARNQDALKRLRLRKHRSDKPFAVLVSDIETAKGIGVISEDSAALLESRSRPIVLVPFLADSGIAPEVAPGLTEIGIMLPSTPIQFLLIKPGEAWVMTSGNVSSEPIVTDNEEARSKLAHLADGFVMNDRDISVACDDSVLRSTSDQAIPVRRSRGYAPFPVRLAFQVEPSLAVGGELKATFCLGVGSSAFMSQHLGDMENLATLNAFTKAVEHFRRLFRVEPKVLVADLHPRYLSGRWAEDQDLPLVRVQHHHAHIASLLAEHRFGGPIIGFSFDGTGFGPDGSVWGGEVLVGDLDGFERRAYLATVLLPGGDTAIRRPYRMALSYLHSAGIPWMGTLPPVAAATELELKAIEHQLATGLNSIPTSSAGRLFDAVASLADLIHEVTYEGQAAMQLEAAIDLSEKGRYQMPINQTEGGYVIDPLPAVRAILSDLRDTVPVGRIAARFHRGLSQSICDAAVLMRRESGISTVGLSGGVFQNAALTGEAVELLVQHGFEVLLHRLVPPNDGGLALGQLALGAR